jgi:hypothetical protein
MVFADFTPIFVSENKKSAAHSPGDFESPGEYLDGFFQ